MGSVNGVVDSESAERPDGAVPAESSVSAGSAPEKTITGIFAACYRALNAAGALAQACDAALLVDSEMGDGVAVLGPADPHVPLPGYVKALHDALADVPQSDMDALVKHVLATYQALEGLHILGLSFEKSAEGVLAKVTLRFGAQDVTLAAPFDRAGSAVMLADLQKAVGPKSAILRVN